MTKRIVAWRLALMALAIAVSPWAGGAVPAVDRLAVPLPAVPVLAVLVLLLDRGFAAVTAGIALVVSAFVMVPEWRSGASVAGGTGMKLVIVTHNVSVHNEDPDATEHLLAQSGADILLLQEVDGVFRPQLERLRAQYPYGSSCNGCSLAILSRLPMEKPRYRFRDAEGQPFGPALVQARLSVGGVDAAIATVHLSRTMSAWARERQRLMLADAVQRIGGGALIVGGDFNTTPWQASMLALDRMMMPMTRATRAIFSFPARVEGYSVPFPVLPIDHLYAGPQWTIASAQRLPRTGSDHYPIRVELVLRRQQI